MHEYASAFLQRAWTAKGPILECGSGLSTILLGLVADRTGNEVWSLEHSTFWAERVRSTLKRHNLQCVRLCQSELRNCGAYLWYDPPKDTMPKDFSLVVCDGPPGNTLGGRYGMLPIMLTLKAWLYRIARRCRESEGKGNHCLLSRNVGHQL
jgi:hypothetical protein